MRKVLIVFGTRPEAIKLVPIIKELEQRPERFSSVVCVTGQHRYLLDQVLNVFEIKPLHDLSIMTEDQSLFDITTQGLLGVQKVLELERPDILLVQGDTTTAFTSALAAFYLGIPIGHVEAGLRTWNKHHPFPEEINRRLTSHLADWHFAPTAGSRENLLAEGIADNTIFVTGNTVVDALLLAMERLSSHVMTIPSEILLLIERKKLVLVTGHRRESFGEGLRNICEALREIVRRHPDTIVVYPVHLNPNVRGPVNSLLGETERVFLLEPLDYLSFVYLLQKAYLILTDSGGIQEEAPSLGKPVLVMREVTERPEGVEAGTVRVVGTDAATIVNETERLLLDPTEYLKMARSHNPYGDGQAASRILQILQNVL